MAHPRARALRRRRARAVARGRNALLEARLAHPVFDGVRSWLAGERTLARLNRLSEQGGVRTESGRAIRFVPPGPRDVYYELKVFETGCVETRPESLHDFFNALAWLAFPRTKARINALHAAEIPREAGRRSRLRDLLTIFDEGGAIVHCDDERLRRLLAQGRWKELFWAKREEVKRGMRIVVVGHAVLEKALEPWPGVTCKALLAPMSGDPDAHARAWLDNLPADASPRLMPPVPIYGYPDWLEQDEAFYDDARYFRQGKT